MSEISVRCKRCLRELDYAAKRCSYCGKIVGQDDTLIDGSLKPGAVISERYLVGECLRYNGQFMVYNAYDKHLGVFVVVKEYMPTQIAYRKNNCVIAKDNKTQIYIKDKTSFVNLHKLLLDFRTMPCVEQVASVIEENNTCYVVLNEMKGELLCEYLAKNYGELSWRDIGHAFIDFMKALTYLHNSGVLHLGISPYTIVVEKSGSFKLIDFATRSFRVKNNEIKSQLYEGYAALEQYTGKDCGTYTDVYGIGAIMYKTLTGTMPVASNTRQVKDNLIAPGVLNEDIPKNVSLAIMGALTIPANLRTQTVEDFYADTITPLRTTQIIKPIELEVKEESGSKNRSTPKLILVSLFSSLGLVLLIVGVIILIIFRNNFF